MNTYEERMAPLFSQILLQREFEQREILRNASERAKLGARVQALPEEDYERFERAACELRALRSALERIRARIFGKCADCGQAIDLLRLNAYPTDPYCLSCEYKRSRTCNRKAN